jgi:hypothetical protein
MTAGQLSISPAEGHGGGRIRIAIQDDATGRRVLVAAVTLEDFARAVTGSVVRCELDVKGAVPCP